MGDSCFGLESLITKSQGDIDCVLSIINASWYGFLLFNTGFRKEENYLNTNFISKTFKTKSINARFKINIYTKQTMALSLDSLFDLRQTHSKFALLKSFASALL